MRRVDRWWARILALVVLAAGGACGGDESDADEPNCLHDALASGVGYRYDVGAALTVTHAITATHPDLSELVDTVTAHLRENPDHRALELDDIDAVDGRVAFVYMATVVTLAERPDIATPELLAVLVDEAGNDGISGVNNVVISSRRFPTDDPAAQPLRALSDEVRAREDSIIAAGISSLPNGACTMEDAFGGEG